MSDVPLLKREFYFNNNKNTNQRIFYKEDVLDALRKFQDYLKKRMRNIGNIEYEDKMIKCVIGQIGYKFIEIFGVLDSQDNSHNVMSGLGKPDNNQQGGEQHHVVSDSPMKPAGSYSKIPCYKEIKKKVKELKDGDMIGTKRVCKVDKK
ncbi:MAG: hypothetical protein WC307_05130 [Candidatus Nanoarchaeia archaeon]|jgi:hypothetical protein